MNAPHDVLMGMVPAAVSTPDERVVFASAGASRFSDPFYDDALNRLAATSTVRTVELGFDEVRRVVGDAAPAPMALVFHTGRCGSTLLMRMLARNRGAMPVSEPHALGLLVREAMLHPEGASLYLQTVADLLVVLDRFAATRNQRPIVKFPSWLAVNSPDLAALLPNVPIVAVHRPVEEVVASELNDVPGWTEWIVDAIDRIGAWPSSREVDRNPSQGELLAAVWAAEVDALLSLPVGRVHFAAYRDLVEEPEDTMRAIAAHIGFGGAWDPASGLSELPYYAKSSNAAERFEPHGRHARPPLQSDVHARVVEIASDLPDRLASRTNGGKSSSGRSANS